MRFEYKQKGQFIYESGMVNIYGVDDKLVGCISKDIATVLCGALWVRKTGENNEYDRLMMNSLWKAIGREEQDVGT